MYYCDVTETSVLISTNTPVGLVLHLQHGCTFYRKLGISKIAIYGLAYEQDFFKTKTKTFFLRPRTTILHSASRVVPIALGPYA